MAALILAAFLTLTRKVFKIKELYWLERKYVADLDVPNYFALF